MTELNGYTEPRATSHDANSLHNSPYENVDREILDSVYDIITPYSEMGKNQRYFLNGLIRSVKPRKVLEVGVSSGGGTVLILNAVFDIDGAEVYSVDYLKEAYRYPEKPSGFLVQEQFPALVDKWHAYRGGDVSRFIREIGGDIDMLVLDTSHKHPCETLNFLCILPFMKNNSWTVLHDITLHSSRSSRFMLACRYLFASVVSDSKIMPTPEDSKKVFSNIGAFRVTDATRQYVNNLFESLLIPWDEKLPASDMDAISSIIKEYYSPDQYEFFCRILDFQEYLRKNPATIREGSRIFVMHSMPRVFGVIQRIKHFIKH